MTDTTTPRAGVDPLWLEPNQIVRGVIETCCGWTGGGGFARVPVCLAPIVHTSGDFNNGGVYRVCKAGHITAFGYYSYLGKDTT